MPAPRRQRPTPPPPVDRIEIDVRAYQNHQWQWYAFKEETARDTAVIAGIRGGKTSLGSNKFLRRILEAPVGVALLSGPDLPTIKQTSLETILHGMGPKQVGRWPVCRQPACPSYDNVVCEHGHSLVVDHNRSDKVLELRTGHRVLYRGGDNPDDLRGPAAVAWWADEITLCKPELLRILQGRTLDTGGHGLCTGTPKGRRNWFFRDVMARMSEVIPGRVWRNDRWCVVRYPTRENPAIKLEDLEGLAADYPGKLKQQELDGVFVDWGGVVFDGDVLSGCLTTGASHFHRPEHGHRLVMGVDPAGRGRDWWAIVVVCASCRSLVEVWRQQRVQQFRPLYHKVATLCRDLVVAEVVVDETSMGGQAILEELEYEVAAASRGTYVTGYTMTARSKFELIAKGAARLEEGFGLTTEGDGDTLLNELRNYDWEDGDLVTDCVIALCLALWPLQPVGMVAPGNNGLVAGNVGTMRRPALDRDAIPR